jgi:succinate dehydrogenase/fumarate reductase-like Fe-S protein
VRRRVDGILAFRKNYDEDGLPPVNGEERARMARFSRCIACGLCDRGEAARIGASGGAYRGVMALALAASRSMPDYRAAAYSFGFVSDEVLADKEMICPTAVPLREIAQFVREKALEVGGPLPLPRRIRSLPPRDGG